MTPLLKKGDKVYLLTKNLKTKKRSKKLNHIKVESFFIQKVKGPNNYKLNLLKDVKIHSIFDISLLESAHPNTLIQEKFHYQTQEGEEFEVEKILKQKNQKYLVK